MTRLKKRHKKLLIAAIFSILMLGSVFLFISKQDEIDIKIRTLHSQIFYFGKSYSSYVEQFPDIETSSNQTYAIAVPVLVYHGIVEKADGFNMLSDDFREQMFALKRDGWQTASIKDFNAFIKGERNLPDKSFLLTFDDGRKDSYYNADPVLKDLNYTAVMFVISGESLEPLRQDSKFHLNKKELRKMIKDGRWEIEAHAREGHGTITISENGQQGYFYSNKMWLSNFDRIETDEEFRERIYEDLVGVKEDLESTFGIEVTAFAYPFGDFGKDSINFAGSKDIITNITGSIFDLSFYQTWVGLGYTYNYPHEEKMLIKRIEPTYNWSGDELLNYLEFGMGKKLPYDSFVSGFDGWVENTGILEDSQNVLTLSSDPEKFAGFSFLDGTYSWKDYSYKMNVHSFNAESFSLISRASSTSDYLACIFSKKNARIASVKGGDSLVINQREINLPDSEEFNVEMAVFGDEVQCLVNNKVVVETKLDSSKLDQGGVAFGVWNPKSAANPLVINRIEVIEIY